MNRRFRRGHRRDGREGRDRGAVDSSVTLLFGAICLLAVFLLLLDVTAYWHARNVFDDAAADGARVAAARGGSCAAGVAEVHAAIAVHDGGWADEVQVSCTDGPTVTVTVHGRSRGILARGAGLAIDVSQSQPSEG